MSEMVDDKFIEFFVVTKMLGYNLYTELSKKNNVMTLKVAKPAKSGYIMMFLFSERKSDFKIKIGDSELHVEEVKFVYGLSGDNYSVNVLSSQKEKLIEEVDKIMHLLN